MKTPRIPILIKLSPDTLAKLNKHATETGTPRMELVVALIETGLLAIPDRPQTASKGTTEPQPASIPAPQNHNPSPSISPPSNPSTSPKTKNTKTKPQKKEVKREAVKREARQERGARVNSPLPLSISGVEIKPARSLLGTAGSVRVVRKRPSDDELKKTPAWMRRQFGWE